jgi:hypothetical protein
LPAVLIILLITIPIHLLTNLGAALLNMKNKGKTGEAT